MKNIKIYILIVLAQIAISCKDNYQKIGNYKLIPGPMNGICLAYSLEDENPIMIINEHILFYGYSEEFMLFNQKSSDSIIKTIETIQTERKRKIYSSSFNQFYILDIKKKKKYGPFNKQDYLKTKNDLGISKNFKMNHSTLKSYNEGQRNDINYKNPDPDVIDVKNLKGNSLSSFW
jgi:hypothetical protein